MFSPMLQMIIPYHPMDCLLPPPEVSPRKIHAWKRPPPHLLNLRNAPLGAEKTRDDEDKQKAKQQKARIYISVNYELM